jgi:hypothetical protein
VSFLVAYKIKIIIFDNPHKMGLSQPICEVSLKKWGLYISYGLM